MRMYGQDFQQRMDQPGMAANSTRGQLNRKNAFSPVPVRAQAFGLTRRVRPSCPAAARSFSILRLNQSGASSRASSRFPRWASIQAPSGQSRGDRITHLRIDGVRCRESAGGTGPAVVNVKVVPVTGAAFAGFPLKHYTIIGMYVWSFIIITHGKSIRPTG